MQFNPKLPQITVGEKNQGPKGPIKKNKKWPPIYFLELPRTLYPRHELSAPAVFIQELAIAKEMMLWAAKSSDCLAFWSKERKQWLLVSKERFEPKLESFCSLYSGVKMLKNRQCDYAAVNELLN